MNVKLNELYRANYDYLVGASRDFDSQIDWLDKIFQENQVKTILDCGCGTGTHAILLAKRGYQVTAFDFNINQVKLAKKKAEKAGVEINFQVADIKDFNFGQFDAIISLFSVITFACQDLTDLTKVMNCIKKSLKPGGIAFLETSTPKLFEAEKLKTQKHSGEKLDVARVRFYEETNTKNLVDVAYVYLIKETGKEVEKIVATATNRFFTKEEMESAIKQSGLQLSKLYGSFDRETGEYSSFGEDSFFISPLIKNIRG
tara:strand:+ start:1366 stop:2139 length:774 start_codon:yes stop_codon:yes gene_type:complete